MDNNEEWISLTEMDRRVKLHREAYAAAKNFIDNINWQAFNSLYKYHVEVLESHKRMQESMGASYDYGQQEARAERSSQKEGVIKLMDDIRSLAITNFGVVG